MADANQAAEELARKLQEVQAELAAHSRVSQRVNDELLDAQMKAKYGMESFTKGTAKGADAVGSLASAGLAAGRAMLEGKKGAAAFNSALDQMTTAAMAAGTALTFLLPGGPLIKGIVVALTAVTTAAIKYAQAANEMADKLYAGFRGLAKSGAAASDGMTGVMKGAQKLGLSMNELNDYVQIVSENSRDLANLGGSVYKGRQALENMGKAMEPAREAMLKMGLMPKDVAEGMAGYLRTQTRLGYAQKMSVDQLAEGARKYLVEQDALTKLTGVERAEREKMREEALLEQQFAGTIRKLQLQGKDEEAKRLMDINDAASTLDKEFGKLVRSAMTSNLSNEAAQKLLMSAPDVFALLQKGQKGVLEPMEVTARIARQVGKTADRLVDLAPLEAFNDTFVDMGLSQKVRIAEEKGLSNALAEIRQEQERQGATGKKAADAMLEGQVKLIDAQVRATIATELFISKGIEPAQKAMKAIADATLKAAGVLDELTPGGKSMEKKTAENVGAGAGALAGALAGVKLGAMVGAGFGGVGAIPGSVIGALLGATGGAFGLGYAGKAAGGAIHDATAGGPPGRAAGGPVDAGKLYKVGERGEEYFRPNIAGEIVPHGQIAGITGAATNRIDVIQRAAKDIADDTATLAKLTDLDLKKTQDFNRTSDRLRKLKTDLMTQEVDLLEEQNSEMEKMLEHMEKTMGKSASDSMRRNIVMQRAMGGGAGTGLQMPSAPGLSSMGGAQGMQIMNQDDLRKLGLNVKAGDVQASNAKISPKLIELAKAIQAGVPGFGHFSSFNDRFHNENAPSSMHTQGLAVDFTVAQPPSIQDGKAITSWLKSMGASVAIDEYNSPTAKSTGGHFHAQLPAFEDGGTLGAGKLGIAGEAGKPELITGPAEITPINELMKAFGSLAGMMSQSVDKLDELVRAQKTNNDISSKILRSQA